MNNYNYWLLLFCIYAFVISNTVRGQENTQGDGTYREFTMPGVTPKTNDAYVCTSMRLNSSEEWILRYDPMASANRAHHMLLYGCSTVANSNKKGYWDCGHHQVCGGSVILYAWAKNAPSTALPQDVGMRIGRSTGVNYLVLQIHYAKPLPNNIKDHSGLKMLITEKRQKYKAGIYLLALSYLKIPPHEEKVHGDINCLVNLSEDIMLFAYRVHAHSLGAVISGYRYDQKTMKIQEIAKGNPQWPQSFYPTKEVFTIKPTDILHARCTYNSSQRARVTYIGATSNDEMCNLYLMFYTDRKKGPNNGYCTRQQYKELTLSLPKTSDETLPQNEKLREQSVGENTNKNKEISYLNLFQSTKNETEKHSQKLHQERNPMMPNPIKVNTGYEKTLVDSSRESSEEDSHEIIDEKRKTTIETEFHLEDNWFSKSYKLGQISAVAVDSLGDVVIFHRAGRVWDASSFHGNRLGDIKPIFNHTLLHIQKDSGVIMHKWGNKFFYMPHGLTIDNKDNLWMTDVGMHQVFKFPAGYGNGKPQITLGERFEPGNGKNKFCKPTAVAVMQNGEFFVSDGYCNSRIVHFSAEGKLIKEIDSSKTRIDHGVGSFSVPHSLTLTDNDKEVCVADRENGRVLCFYTLSFALSRKFKFEEWGRRIFSVVYSKTDGKLYAVNGPHILNKANKVMIFQIDFSSNIFETSFSPYNQGLSNPHDITVSLDGNNLYVVEIGPNKLWKYSKENSSQKSSSRRIIADTKKSLHDQQNDAVNALNLLEDGWSSSSISYIIISLLAIPIIVLAVLTMFLRSRKKSSLNRYFDKVNLGGNQSGLSLLRKKHNGFERVPTTDSHNDFDSSDSEIEEFPLNVAKV